MVQRPEWAYYNREAPDGDREAGRGAPPDVRNAALIMALLEGAGFTFRGQVYDLPPVPFLDGLELAAIRRQLDEVATRSQADEVDLEEARRIDMEARRCIRHLLPVLKRLARPRGWLRRLTWRLRRNPFRLASQAELEEILTFSLVCRMKSSTRYRTSEEAGDRFSTLQTPWQSSPASSPRGSTIGASP